MRLDRQYSAVRRAARLIQAHPRVVRVDDNIDAGLSIVAHIDTGLNNRWRARGHSENGVLAVEAVTFQFSELYPLAVPEVTLRLDFDRSHPHLLPGPASDAPRPCYLEGSPRDLLRQRGPQGLVTQLADWLEKAATAELINPTQGWEPIRRDHLDDYVEVDPSILRSRVSADGGGAFYYAPFTMLADDTGWRCYCAHFMDETPLRSDTVNWLSERFGQVGLGIVVWSGKASSGGPFIAKRYLPETVSNVSDLFRHASAIGVAAQLRAQVNLLRQRLRGWSGSSPILVSVVLLARRPLRVIGQDSAIELLPYIIEVKRVADLDETSTHPVRLACQRDVISGTLLQRMSGTAGGDPADWTLIGAGSVGSKIALHLAREGRAPQMVVDNGSLLPHNFSRHGLLPRPRGESLYDGKAQALINAIGLLGQRTLGNNRDAVALCSLATKADRDRLWPPGTRFVVDATGSPAVTDALCLPAVVSSRPRAIETSLMARGHIGYLSVEGPDSNPNLQDIAAEAYRIIAANENLRTPIFGSLGDRIPLGQGCSTITAQMSDSTLSATIPAMSMTLSEFLREGLLTEAGEIFIGVVEPNLLGQTWARDSVRPFTIVGGNTETAPVVRISANVVDTIDRAIAERAGVETGGVLMGRYNETTNSFHIVDTLPPPADSQFSASLFLLGIDGLAEAIRSYVERANGTIFALGTWHNHLLDSPASRTDLISGLEMAFAQTFPALLLIRTPLVFRGLVIDSFGLSDTDEGKNNVTVMEVSEVTS
ncbi:hypothetical protein M728_005175 (plasmid) [Ensifer sp. WSM1721]|uniref:hypothetical protein n=1 Tax=Ensifer sp. WSM1721 TaxID=1041159 RepID=UPI0004AFD65F|nr:hypothetical protein [Ensifer sp. WSM1721]